MPRRSAAEPPDDSLVTYRRKRDFGRTAEPEGRKAPPHGDGGADFVVQRHRARRLHYDLRLEVDGVLVSWAVPKGPTLDPDVRSLAVHVEDHPLDYADFEGTIPAGEYGGGDVIVWDRGRWQPEAGVEPAAAIANGELHFDLFGDKLRGRFVLVRTRRAGSGSGKASGKDQWLLLHKHDEHARPGWNPEDHSRSVVSGRTNDEVAAGPDRRWPVWEPPDDDELAALDALAGKGRWRLQGRELALTNLDKVLFPGRDGEAPLTKRDLVRHYASLAPALAPHLVDRPLNLHRLPDGVGGKHFWQKALPSHAPDWLVRWRYDDARPGETEEYLVADGAPSLAWMANFGAIELHPWTSTTHAPHEPTWAMIDIDPGPATTFDEIVTLARLHRSALEHLGVRAGPKVSGRRGIQILVPVRAGYSFDETRAWVEQLSRAIGAVVPELVSWSWRTEDRSGKARLDYTQNAVNKTLVAPWCPRPAAGAPVAVPIEWAELDDPELTPDRWTIRSTPQRLAENGDPLAALVGVAQALPSLVDG